MTIDVLFTSNLRLLLLRPGSKWEDDIKFDLQEVVWKIMK
jgi:hypothetical protein